MKRTHLRSKDLNIELAHYNLDLSKKDQVELVENKFKILLINHQPAFFYTENKAIPTLKFLQTHPALLKTVTIDMGAVKFIIQWADVMRPGIVAIDESILKDDIITIIDEKNKKPIAIGKALFSQAEMQVMKTGKVIKNIHYVGDELWKLEV